MSTTKQKLPLDGIADFIVREELATEEDVRTAITVNTKDQSKSILSVLINRKLMTEESYTSKTADFFGLRTIDISSFKISDFPSEYFISESMLKYSLLPIFKKGKLLTIAVSNPLNISALKELQFRFNTDIEIILTKNTPLCSIIESALKKSKSNAMEEFNAESFEDIDLDIQQDSSPTEADDDSSIDDTPIVKFINKIILDAINKDASDIHFEPYEHSYRVRLRIDGVLEEIASPPAALSSRITSRLKIMSRIDIAEKRVPQDGRFKMNVSKQSTVDFRVSTCPTLFGEKVVLRILDPDSAKMGIGKLGYEPNQKDLYLHALSQKQGMILVTGPTGSGKTVSLYTGLNILNVEESNISTSEDPVEINLPGVNQVNINIRAGLTFSKALKAFLRQDPDVIMVGEIRDLETAEIAVKAAQTGHLVLSTLHTNSAPETLSRLMNMGIESYNIASSIILIIAQRLVRRLCEKCKEIDDIPKSSLLEMGFTEEQIKTGFKVYKQKGCDECNRGYRGRSGIYEVMPISKNLRKIIMQNGNAIDIADQAQKDGINNLRQSALLKAMQGITSLDEVNITSKD